MYRNKKFSARKTGLFKNKTKFSDGNQSFKKLKEAREKEQIT